MNIHEALVKINNLDVTGLRRKLKPKYSLVQIDRKGEIVQIYKYKISPTEEQQLAALKSNPGTIQMPASEDIYKTEEELREAVNSRLWLFDNMKTCTEMITEGN